MGIEYRAYKTGLWLNKPLALRPPGQRMRVLRSKIGREVVARVRIQRMARREVEQQLPLVCPPSCQLCWPYLECWAQ
jgi:hypothetical protein